MSDVLIEQRTSPTPLPRFQLFIIYLIQFAEPITALVIYPFINQLVRDTGITNGDEMKTGHYAGVIESAFFLAECLTVVQWGYLSDRFGRRPVLLIGPLGLSIFMLFFGLSTTFWPLVVLRCLQGTFNGNIGVSKTVIAEITDETNIGDAFAYSPILWNTGSTISPFIGGILSQPTERWPNIFGRLPFFRTYPYFLPCATASCIIFLSFVIAFFALEETLPSIVAKRKQSQESQTAGVETPLINQSDNINYGSITTTSKTVGGTESSHPTAIDENRKSSFHMLIHRPMLLVFINYAFLTFLSMANAVLLPLMYSTPLEYGGLGLDPFTLGTTFGTFSFANAAFQAKFLGPLIRRFGTRKLYSISTLLSCLVFPVYPVMKYAAQRAGGVDGSVIVCIAIHLLCRVPVAVTYGTIQVLIVQSVPEGGSLAAANGIGQMLSSGMRTIAPSLSSSLFSISLQRNLAGGNLVYYLLFGMSLLSLRMSWLLRDRMEQNSGSQTPNVSTT